MKKFGHDMEEGQLLALLETDKGKALVAQLGRQMKREKVKSSSGSRGSRGDALPTINEEQPTTTSSSNVNKDRTMPAALPTRARAAQQGKISPFDADPIGVRLQIISRKDPRMRTQEDNAFLAWVAGGGNGPPPPAFASSLVLHGNL